MDAALLMTARETQQDVREVFERREGGRPRLVAVLA
jgi:hypothetical protein